MVYDNVFSLSSRQDLYVEFLYGLYVVFTENRDEDVKTDIANAVKNVWKETEKVHIKVMDLYFTLKDDVLKKVVSFLFPKEEKENNDNEFYLGFLCDGSDKNEMEISDFQREAVKLYLLLLEESVKK